MKSIALLVLVTCMLRLPAFAAPPAQDLVDQATAKAVAEQKAVFVHFGASWCGWCKRLDAFLEQPEVKPVFEKYFVPVKLVVQENEKNKGLENPGAVELLGKLGGPSGLPFHAFLDGHGKLIINSKLNGQNIGYPGQQDEIDWFVQMMKKAAPAISDSDVKTIQAALTSPKKT